MHRWLAWFDEKSPPELVEEVVGMDSAIMAANEKQEYLSQDWQERDLYRRRLMAILDYNSGMNHARQEGLQEGKEEIANKLLAEGMSVEFVQKITGLDMETIQGLSS